MILESRAPSVFALGAPWWCVRAHFFVELAPDMEKPDEQPVGTAELIALERTGSSSDAQISLARDTDE